ncbi:MAG TPA: PGF-pre-PGF domain-containing protein [Methanosarcinaceae archaeon]|nr:PGF-pre-PGF domain-containing protein [Methanosarcinaceae archaeon]
MDDGTYYINATAYDLIGNSNVTETRTIVLDTTLPIATFESPTPADNSNLSQNYIDINVSVDEDNFKNVTTYLYNGTGFVNFNVSTLSPLLYNFTNLDDGTYYINATAYDLIGNSNVTETRTIVLDTTLPIATFESPTPADNSNLSQNYIDINVSVDETNLKNVTTYLYNGTGLVDSNVSTLSPLLYNFTNLDDGTYYINATAYDLAGNLNVTETRTIMLDTIAPVSPTITVPTNGATLNISTIWVNGTKSVDTTNVTVYVNGSATNDSVAVSGTTYNISNVPLGADGIHEINVSAMDLAGNINTTNATAIVIVDTTAPDMPTIDMPTNGAILNTSITWVNGTISADTANVTVYVNGSATNDSVAVSGTSYNISNVPLGVDGDYEINVSAKDAAGNVNTTNATVTVIVDTTPPDTPTICVPTDGELLTSLYTWVNGTISADTTNVTIYVNGSITNTSVSVSGTTFNISNVPLGVDGNYEINVSAKDVAGNVNTTNATVTVTVDTIVPIITITTPTTSSKAYKSGGQQMYVNFKYVEANPKNYTIQIHNDTDIINSATATTTSSPVNVSFTMNATAADGYYNVTVTMWDNASNTNSSTAVDSVSMDTTPPTAPTNLVHTDDAPDGYDNDNSTDISWSAATDLYSTVTYRIYRDGIFNNSTTLLAFTFTNETEGQHTYNVSAIDSAGNINTTNATVTIIVDYTDPVIHNVSLSDESPAYDQTIIITVNVTDDYLSNVTAGGTNLTHQSGALWNGTITADYGTNVVTVTAYDNASNSATNTNLSYTGPAAPTDDISSGGVNYPTPLPENVVNNEVKGTIFNEPVSSADLKFTKGYIISVTVDAKGTISEVLVTIQKLVGRPSEIKVAPPSGAVHTYHNIDLGRIENGDLAGANIKFRAEKKWIADNGGDRNAVVVMRYHDGWEALETKPIGEDNEYVFFSARTLGFSTFAITMQLEEGEAVPVEIQTSEPVVEEVVVDEVVPEPDEGTSYWWLVLVMIAIIVVGVVFFIYRNKKDESEYR